MNRLLSFVFMMMLATVAAHAQPAGGYGPPGPGPVPPTLLSVGTFVPALPGSPTYPNAFQTLVMGTPSSPTTYPDPVVIWQKIETYGTTFSPSTFTSTIVKGPSGGAGSGYWATNVFGITVDTSGWNGIGTDPSFIEGIRYHTVLTNGVNAGSSADTGILLAENLPVGSATVTISNATPAVIGWTSSNFAAGEQITFSVTGGALPAPLLTGTALASYPANALTALSYSAGVGTATTTTAHGIVVGQFFTLTGNTPSGYNGTWQAQPGTTGSTLVWNMPSVGAETVLGSLQASLGSPGTVYYVSSSGLTANSFSVSDTRAHAVAGTNMINTTTAGSGTFTAVASVDYTFMNGGESEVDQMKSDEPPPTAFNNVNFSADWVATFGTSSAPYYPVYRSTAGFIINPFNAAQPQTGFFIPPGYSSHIGWGGFVNADTITGAGGCAFCNIGATKIGLDLQGGTYSQGAVRLPNLVPIIARNQANTANVQLLEANYANQVVLDPAGTQSVITGGQLYSVGLMTAANGLLVGGIGGDFTTTVSFPDGGVWNTGGINGTIAASGNGGSASSLNKRLGQQINVVSDFLAKGDMLSYIGGTMTSGSPTLYSTSATFTANDCHSGGACTGPVDKAIVVTGAGTSGANGVSLVSTIINFVDANHVTLANNAVTSTPYYSMSQLKVAAAGTGCAAGDTVALAGGTYTVQTIGTIVACKVVAVAVNAGGTGGTTSTGATSGTCTVTGTTGTGMPFQATATIASGIVTSFGSITRVGNYRVNPTSISAEPVTGCGALSGATVSLTMGVLDMRASTYGAYTVEPSNPISQGTASGSETGITVNNGWWQESGTFNYATDDTTAFTNAWNASITNWAAGTPNCIFVPGSHTYFISGAMPKFYSTSLSWGVPGCVKGEATKKSNIYVSPAMTGDLISWTNTVGSNGSAESLIGPTLALTQYQPGAFVTDLTLIGDRSSTNQQNVFEFYGENSYAYFRNVEALYFNGTALGMGGLDAYSSTGWMTESTFQNFRLYNDGNSSSAVVDIAHNGGQSPNELHFLTFDEFSSWGVGFWLHEGSAQVNMLRIEGDGFNENGATSDSLLIGDPAGTAAVTEFSCLTCKFISPNPGGAAIHLTAASSALMPYNVRVDGYISGGQPLGRGIQIDYGRSNIFNIIGNGSLDYNLITGASPNVGGDNTIYTAGGDFTKWTTSIGSGVTIATSANGSLSAGRTVGGAIFPADYYGSCIWDAGHDVGPCINSAIAAAAANNGGNVLLPCGAFGLATKIVQNNSGVHLSGCGVGTPWDNKNSSKFIAFTSLVWTGTSGATMAYIGPATPFVTNTVSLYSADVTGILFDGADLGGICLDMTSVNNSFINVAGSNCQSVNVEFLAGNTVDAPGFQNNDIWVQSRSTFSDNSPTGIFFDSIAGSSFDVSVNRIWFANAWYYKGDGIVFGNTDHNTIYAISTFPNSGATGIPVVCANTGYTSPNGVSVNAQCRANYFVKVETPLLAAGYQTGSSIVAAGGNSCNGGGSTACGPTTISLSTSGTSYKNDPYLAFSSTSSLSIGEAFSCGTGTGSGVMPNSTIGALASTFVGFWAPQPAATNVSSQGTLANVATSTSCVFGYGIKNQATSGTYTIASTGTGGPFNITAPTGGHSQTGIAIANSTLTFSDMVIPWTGTASNGDTWTVTVPSPSASMKFLNFDTINGVGGPNIGPGATGITGNDTLPNSVAYNYNSQTSTPINYFLSTISTGGSAVDLTSDGTGTLNTFNNGGMQSNTQLSFTAALSAMDYTNPANSYSATWGGGSIAPHILSRGVLPTTTAVDGASAAIPPDSFRSVGASGTTVTLAPNQNANSGGGMIVLFTPPNSDEWHVTMTVAGAMSR